MPAACHELVNVLTQHALATCQLIIMAVTILTVSVGFYKNIYVIVGGWGFSNKTTLPGLTEISMNSRYMPRNDNRRRPIVSLSSYSNYIPTRNDS